MKFSPLFVMASVGFVLVGCSGNSSSSSQKVEPNKFVNGYVGASNIHNAVIQAVPIDSQGQTTTEINDDYKEVYVGDKATSTSKAYYSVEIDSDYVGKAMTLIALPKDSSETTVRCQVVSGCASDWAYLAEKALPDDAELRASVGAAEDNMRINVNWLTHLASAFAYTSYIDTSGSEGESPSTARTGIYSPFTIERANLWIGSMFDVSDIISVTALEPAKLNEDSGLDSAQEVEAAFYGALASASQSLAKEAGVTESDWVYGLVSELLQRQGQLYQKGGSDYSLDAIYAAAYDILKNNRDYLKSRSYKVPSSVDTALDRIANLRAGLVDGQLTNVTVTSETVEKWLDRINYAKTFVEDLNERLVNYKGDDPDTCASGTDQSATDCVHSFIDPAYVAKTVEYYDALNVVYKGAAPALNQAMHELRDASLALITCINSGCTDGRYNAAQQSMTLSGITLTVAGTEEDSVKTDDGKFYAFDIAISSGILSTTYNDGAGTVQSVSIEFAPLVTQNDYGEDVENSPFMRIVYADPYSRIPLTYVADSQTDTLPVCSGCVEPLGFNFFWPYVSVPVTVSGTTQTFDLYVDVSLIGVRDDLTIAGGGNSPYHYNLTDVSLSVLAQGEGEGKLTESGETLTLGDKSEATLTATSANAANYYSDSLWPEADDFFRVREGYEAGLIENGLFSYRVVYAASVLYGTDASDNDVYRTADYIEVNINGYGINRLELFSSDDLGNPGVRKCSVNELAGGVRETDTCTTVVELDENMTIQQLVDEDYLGLFSIPSRGAYRILFNTDSAGKAVLRTDGTDETLNGELEAVFTQGITDLNLRVGQELVECSTADCLSSVSSSFSRLPLAIVDMNLSRETKDEWEVGISAGYDYEYTVGPIPTGSSAQSLYLAYAVGIDDSGSVAYEVSDLAIYRGGVTLFAEEGEALGAMISGDVSYGVDGTDQPCGIINRDQSNASDCRAVGYVNYRGYLVGVIREERDGVYVVRFSDGQFVILGAN